MNHDIRPIAFYILYGNDTEEDCIKEDRQLGSIVSSFKYIRDHVGHPDPTFEANIGFKKLELLIKKYPTQLDKIRIISSTKRHYTVEQFIDKISNCKFKYI